MMECERCRSRSLSERWQNRCYQAVIVLLVSMSHQNLLSVCDDVNYPLQPILSFY